MQLIKLELRKMIMASLKLLSLIFILCALVKAEQPEGYLGCFDEKSLINEIPLSNNVIYAGDRCKDECKLQKKRYAGTKNGHLCSCGDDFHKDRNTTGCDWNCLGTMKNEKCGSLSTESLYDTWMCITGICKNKATCGDIDADHYKCICSDGWTGTFCNASHSTENLFTSTSSSLSTRIASTIFRTAMTMSALVTTTEQSTTQSSWFTGIDETKPTVLMNADGTTTTNNTRLLDNLSDTNIKNHTTAYISVPVILIIVVAIGVIIFLIIRRKRQLTKQDSQDIYNTSKGNTLSFSEENILKHNGHGTIQLEITNCLKDTSEKTMSEKGCSALEEISHHYHTIDPPYHSETEIQIDIPVDEDDYEHIKSTTTLVFDPTYSHTTDLKTINTSEEMYSHVNKVGKKTKPDSNTNQNNEIYDKLNNNATMGKPKPVVHSGETDETYNTVSKTGKIIFHGDSSNFSSLNEPDYDHTDSKDL